MNKIAKYELNGNQQSALIQKASKEVLDEICLKQAKLIDIIDKTEKCCNYEYKEVLCIDIKSLQCELTLHLIKFRKSGICTLYIMSIDIPYSLAKYVIEI